MQSLSEFTINAIVYNVLQRINVAHLVILFRLEECRFTAAIVSFSFSLFSFKGLCHPKTHCLICEQICADCTSLKTIKELIKFIHKWKLGIFAILEEFLCIYS